MVARNVQVGCLLIFTSFILGVIHHIPIGGMFDTQFCALKCPGSNSDLAQSTRAKSLYESFQVRAGETIPLYKFTEGGIPRMGITARVLQNVSLLTTEFCNAHVSINMHRHREYVIPSYTVIDMDVPTRAADMTQVNLQNKFVLPGTIVSLRYDVVCGTPSAPMDPRECAKMCHYPTSIPVEIDMDVTWPEK